MQTLCFCVRFALAALPRHEKSANAEKPISLHFFIAVRRICKPLMMEKRIINYSAAIISATCFGDRAEVSILFVTGKLYMGK